MANLTLQGLLFLTVIIAEQLIQLLAIFFPTRLIREVFLDILTEPSIKHIMQVL